MKSGNNKLGEENFPIFKISVIDGELFLWSPTFIDFSQGRITLNKLMAVSEALEI